MIDKPLLVNVPELLKSERLELRAVVGGVGARINEAIRESLNELQPWMPWATPCPSAEDTEIWCRQAQAKFLAREQLDYHAYLRGTDTFACSCGLYDLRWDVPRMEIGYWCRTRYSGKGFMTEAVGAVVACAFDVLGVERLEIHCDEGNIRSARVAERLGFVLEGALRRYSRGPDKQLRDVRVYGKLRAEWTSDARGGGG